MERRLEQSPEYPTVEQMARWMEDRAKYRVKRSWVIAEKDASCAWCERKITRGSAALGWAFFERGPKTEPVQSGHFCAECGGRHNIEKPKHLPQQGELFDATPS